MSATVEKKEPDYDRYISTLKKELKTEMTTTRWLASYPKYFATLTYSQHRLNKKFSAAVMTGDISTAKAKILKGSIHYLIAEEILNMKEMDNSSFIDTMNFLMAQVTSFKVKDRAKEPVSALRYLWPLKSSGFYYEDIAAKGISEAFHHLRDQKSIKADLINKLYLKYKMQDDPFEPQIFN